MCATALEALWDEIFIRMTSSPALFVPEGSLLGLRNQIRTLVATHLPIIPTVCRNHCQACLPADGRGHPFVRPRRTNA
jgi:hypothetical protein